MDASLWSHLFSSTDGPTVDSSHRDDENSSFRRQPSVPPGFHPSSNLLGEKATSFLYTQNLDPAQQRAQMAPHSQASSTVQDMMPKDAADSSSSASEPSVPRRNLTEAFEELYVETPSDDTTTPAIKQSHDGDSANASKSSIVSPTGVLELHTATTDLSTPPAKQSSPDAKNVTALTVPHFSLHPLLRRDLSQPLVNRVSLHSVIHDINKEATSMAANDDSSFSQTCSSTDDEKGVATALIDEEKWLLSVIEARDSMEVRTVSACPPTFLQAMGEKDYDSSLSTSSREMNRTTLWKPGRSWWEAKSSKNPWIEPSCHNKRWRYLWPLIHYHKLLTKCIKKLKRNGVDVKTSVSPVAVFLREEVCLASDHLAAVSLYDSEEWMECLSFFNGWTDSDPKAEARLRSIVSKLELRPLAEGHEGHDVDSALLRSQIDEKYLRAMAAAREQLHTYRDGEEKKTGDSGRPPRHIEKPPRRKSPSHARTTQSDTQDSKAKSAPQHLSTYSSSAQQPSADSNVKRWGYPPHGGQWWGGGWPQYAYCDESSVHSALTYDSHPKQHQQHQHSQHHQKFAGYNMYPPGSPGGAQFYPPPMSQEQYDYYYGSGHSPPYSDQFHPDHPYAVDSGWIGHPHPHMGDPNMAYCPPTPQDAPPGTPGGPSSPPYYGSGDQTPYNYDPSVPPSPYWGHLDQATLAMTGLLTPQGKGGSPQTPQRSKGGEDSGTGEFVTNAKNPLINHGPHYYYGSYGVPPSPATQFMMSPQQQPNSFGLRGFSPPRPKAQRKPPNTVAEGTDSSTDGTAPSTTDGVVSPPPAVRKLAKAPDADESTEGTVPTEAESHSLPESA